MVNLMLLLWALRLRIEVWANRRVIAVLEATAHQPQQKEKPKRTFAAGFVLILVLLGQLLLILRELGS
jgi:hypothetical protein